jgi:hypothetical protein
MIYETISLKLFHESVDLQVPQLGPADINVIGPVTLSRIVNLYLRNRARALAKRGHKFFVLDDLLPRKQDRIRQGDNKSEQAKQV